MFARRVALVVLGLSLFSANRIFAASYAVTDLGDLGGSSSYAMDINDSGEITGTCWVGSVSRAFLYSNGVMSDLGAMSRDGSSHAFRINNGGQVIGNSCNDACIFSRGGIIDLSARPGFTAHAAYGINDHGQVVGCSDPRVRPYVRLSLILAAR